MTNHHQRTFNPVDYGFEWIENGQWYKWDRKAGHSAALKARNTAVRELRKDGYKVTIFTLRDQRVRRGGIGSGHPEIDNYCSVYGYNAERIG